MLTIRERDSEQWNIDQIPVTTVARPNQVRQVTGEERPKARENSGMVRFPPENPSHLGKHVDRYI